MSTATEIPSNTGSTNMQTSDRRCENPDCNVSKLISMVPKRKITQFVSDPVVIEKPMLVNGFTAVFQVDGSSARLMDIKNPNGDPQTKPIYRIIPNSHVHVVNYVVVDTDETYLKKITENDPVTMQKLLTSQKESADQMLKKIMSGQGSSATAAMTTVVSTINNNNNATTQPAAPIPQSNVNNSTVASATMASTNAAQKNTIKLPVRMHPNLKITAVASGEAVNTPNLSTNAVASANTVPAPAPYIQPVPLTNLQSPTTALQTNIAAPAPSTSSNLGTVDKPTYDKMQAEINDLRRTVAMLAEAQAKNQQNQQQQSTNSKPAKRARISLPKCV